MIRLSNKGGDFMYRFNCYYQNPDNKHGYEELIIEALKDISHNKAVYAVIGDRDLNVRKNAEKNCIDRLFPTIYVYIEGYKPFFINYGYGFLEKGMFTDKNMLTWNVAHKKVVSNLYENLSPVGQMMRQISTIKDKLSESVGKDIINDIPKHGLFLDIWGEYKKSDEICNVFGITVAKVPPDEHTIARYIERKCLNDSYEENGFNTINSFLEISDVYNEEDWYNDDLNDYDVKEAIKYYTEKWYKDFSSTNDESDNYLDDAFSEAWALIQEGELSYDDCFDGEECDISTRDISDELNMLRYEQEASLKKHNYFLKEIALNPIFEFDKVNAALDYIVKKNDENPGGERLTQLRDSFYPNEVFLAPDVFNHEEKYGIKLALAKKYVDVLISTVSKRNSGNPFYVKPEWYNTPDERLEKVKPLAIKKMIAIFIAFNLPDVPQNYIYDINKIYDWGMQTYPFKMMNIAASIVRQIDNQTYIFFADEYEGGWECLKHCMDTLIKKYPCLNKEAMSLANLIPEEKIKDFKVEINKNVSQYEYLKPIYYILEPKEELMVKDCPDINDSEVSF